MKTTLLAFSALAAAGAFITGCETRSDYYADNPPARPYVYPAVVNLDDRPASPPPQQIAPQPVYVYDQKPLTNFPVLFSQPQADAIVDDFRANLVRFGGSRILIYVNRDLVDEQSGLKLSARTERVDVTHQVDNNASSASTNGPDSKDSTYTHTVADNTYRDNGKTAPTLADRQTVRDVERLMGRPLRAGGATLVDQRVAAQRIGDRPLTSLTLENEQARKDREAVGTVADVVLEVLISSRNVTVQEISGDKTYTVPDIQVTAIRLKDAKVLGQASAADVINRAGGPAVAARNFGVEDITEATALALMQDMAREGK